MQLRHSLSCGRPIPARSATMSDAGRCAEINDWDIPASAEITPAHPDDPAAKIDCQGREYLLGIKASANLLLSPPFPFLLTSKKGSGGRAQNFSSFGAHGNRANSATRSLPLPAAATSCCVPLSFLRHSMHVPFHLRPDP